MQEINTKRNFARQSFSIFVLYILRFQRIKTWKEVISMGLKPICKPDGNGQKMFRPEGDG